MSGAQSGNARKIVRKRTKGTGIYMRNVITRRIRLPFTAVGNNIRENIQFELKREFEGKCVKEGYIKEGSVRTVGHSAGVVDSRYVLFDVVFECLVCHPVEGMNIRCVVKNVTKAGIRAETKEEKSPVVIFIARDHHHRSQAFSSLEVGGDITVKVIGIRYELNDEYISIIAELVERKRKIQKKKSKITIEET